MDRNEFRSAASEVVTRAEVAEAEQGPTRPQNLYTAAELEGYNHPGMKSQQTAALKTNDRINAPYFEHAAQAKLERDGAQNTFEQKIEHSKTLDQNPNREAKQPESREDQQSQQQEFDWNRYTQDKSYASVVDGLLAKQEAQQNINSRKR